MVLLVYVGKVSGLFGEGPKKLWDLHRANCLLDIQKGEMAGKVSFSEKS